MGFLHFLQNIRFPAADAFFELVTNLGGEVFLISAMLVLCWCVDKKHSYYLMAVGFFGVRLNQLLKIVCQVPRPWVRDPTITVVGNAMNDAGGYSFPSGHTQNVAAVGGAFGRLSKSRAVRIVCAVVIVLVGFSRMYLGVHTPADVLVGLAISLAFVFGLYPLFDKYADSTRFLVIVFSVLAVLSLNAVLYLEIHDWPADIDADNLAEALKSMWMMLGCSVGAVIAIPIERRYIRYETQAPLWAQFVKCALGLACVLGLRLVLKAPLIALFGGNPAPAAGVRYMLLLMFSMLVWPLTFKWFAAAGKTKKQEE